MLRHRPLDSHGPTQPEQPDELLTIADAADTFIDERAADRSSIFVRELLSELRTATDAARRLQAAMAVDDPLGPYVYLRVVLEVTIRLQWLGGDTHEPDVAVLRERIERQRARDLSRLSASLAALPDGPHRRRAVALVHLELATVRARKAPAAIEQLAVTEEAGEMYGAHRLCSALIHPGAGIRRIEMMDPEHARRVAAVTLDYATKIAATCIGVLDRDRSRN